MSDEVRYTCDPNYRKFTPKHKSEFSRLLRSSAMKKRRAKIRVSHYQDRNFNFSFGTKIQPRYFCLTCRTNQCRNYKIHKIIEISPIVRIPKQTASKKKWNEFFAELGKYHPTIKIHNYKEIKHESIHTNCISNTKHNY